MPEPVWPDYSVALTEDGKRFLALEPPPRPIVPLRRRPASQRRVVLMMNQSSEW